ncbi:MAG: flagellar hook-basal body protein, partial [Alicyclobacillus sp.]|nr:flagellar hook-basal body protein [Alicyclobacillus sp.]
LWSSLTALQASSLWIDRLAQNVANTDTPGYAAASGGFADALTAAVLPDATAAGAAGRLTPPGWRGGSGVRAEGATLDFSAMPLQLTHQPTDLAVQGPGFFALAGAHGERLLTKAGNFTWSPRPDGSAWLTSVNGLPVLDSNGQPILAPGGQTDGFAVSPDGDVSFHGQPTGQRLGIWTVNHPEYHLQPAGDNTYLPSPGALVQAANPVNGGNTGGWIQQGALSQSNVDLAVQMSQLLQAQRLFDLNAAALQVSEKMMQDANSIRT